MTWKRCRLFHNFNYLEGKRTTVKKIYWMESLSMQTHKLRTRLILTYLLTPWSRDILEKLTGSAASQEIPSFFGTRRFFTVPTSVRQLSLSWANSIQSSQLPPTSWRSILILSSPLRLGLPNGLFPSGRTSLTQNKICWHLDHDTL